MLRSFKSWNQQQERYRQEKFRAYEDFSGGTLAKDAYLKQRAEIDSKLAAAKDQFKLLIGLDLKEEIDLKADMEFEAFIVDMQLAIDEALRNRMEIKEDNLDIELQAIEVKRAKREREFKGNISAYYDFTGLSTRGDGTVGQLVGSSFDNMRDRPANRGIALTVSYPLLDWGRAKNQVRREQVRLKQRELNLDNTKRTIEQEIREIVRSVYEAEKRYRINRRNQEVAIQSYRISQMRFENGDMTSQELSIEQERLSQVQLAYIDSYITYRLSVADLNRKTMYDFEHNRSFLPEKDRNQIRLVFWFIADCSFIAVPACETKVSPA